MNVKGISFKSTVRDIHFCIFAQCLFKMSINEGAFVVTDCHPINIFPNPSSSAVFFPIHYYNTVFVCEFIGLNYAFFFVTMSISALRALYVLHRCHF